MTTHVHQNPPASSRSSRNGAPPQERQKTDELAASVDAAVQSQLGRASTQPRSLAGSSSQSGTLQIDATPSTELSANDATVAVGRVSLHNHPNIYKHKSVFRWKEKRYVFELEIPILTPEKELIQAQREELDDAVAKYKKMFVQNLIQKMSNQSGIRAGDSFEILFTNEGYVVYIPNPEINFDPETHSIQEAITSGYMQSPITVEDNVARAFSDIIQSGTAKGIEEGLKLDILKTYLPSQPKPSASGPFRPVGLENPNRTNCYFNTAFQMWMATPAIRDLVNHPELIRDGESSLLYKALKDYTNGLQPLDLTALKTSLGLKNEQNDSDDAIQCLQAQLIESPGSSLHCQVQLRSKQLVNEQDVWVDNEQKPIDRMIARRTIRLESGKSFEQLYNEPESEVYVGDPNVEYIYINRMIADRLALSDSDKRGFLKTVMENASMTDAVRQQLSLPLSGQSLKDEGALKLANTILSNDAQFETAFSLLNQKERDAFWETVRQQKNKVVINPPTKIGERELCSFSVHTGTANGGHHYAYVRDGDNYWKISDTSVEKLPDSSEFRAQLKNASSLMYAKKGAASPASQTGASGAAAASGSAPALVTITESDKPKQNPEPQTQRTENDFQQKFADKYAIPIGAYQKERSSRPQRIVVDLRPGQNKGGLDPDGHAYPAGTLYFDCGIDQFSPNLSLEEARAILRKNAPTDIPVEIIVPAESSAVKPPVVRASTHSHDTEEPKWLKDQVFLTIEKAGSFSGLGRDYRLKKPLEDLQTDIHMQLDPLTNSQLPPEEIIFVFWDSRGNQPQPYNENQNVVSVDLANYPANPEEEALRIFRGAMVECATRNISIKLLVPLGGNFYDPLQLVRQCAELEIVQSQTISGGGQRIEIGKTEGAFTVEIVDEPAHPKLSVGPDPDSNSPSLDSHIGQWLRDSTQKGRINPIVFDLRTGPAGSPGSASHFDVPENEDMVEAFSKQLRQLNKPILTPIRVILPKKYQGRVVEIQQALKQAIDNAKEETARLKTAERNKPGMLTRAWNGIASYFPLSWGSGS